MNYCVPCKSRDNSLSKTTEDASISTGGKAKFSCFPSCAEITVFSKAKLNPLVGNHPLVIQRYIYKDCFKGRKDIMENKIKNLLVYEVNRAISVVQMDHL